MAIDPTQLADLSDADLQALLRSAQKLLEQRAAQRAKAKLQEARRLAAEAGYQATFAKAGKAGAKDRSPAPRAKAARKYRNPENPSETWSGRGRPPQWVQAALARGQELSDLAIPAAEAAG